MTNKATIMLFAFLVACPALSRPAAACTAFSWKRGKDFYCAQNLDWHIGNGVVLVNPKGLKKTSVVIFEPSAKIPAWTAKYGSITFNQYGRDLPMGGMNEKGLVVSILMLQNSQYPKPDQRPALEPMAWAQYHLDTAVSIDEVLASTQAVRVAYQPIGLHFLISDATGESVVVEFVEGRQVVYRGKDLPYPVLANNKYADNVAYLRTGRGGTRHHENSTERFASCAKFIADAGNEAVRADQPQSSPASGIHETFKQQAKVAQGGMTPEAFTKWCIVYEPEKLQIHWRTTSHLEVKTIRLKAFDFSHKTGAIALDVNSKPITDPMKVFQPFTTQDNRNLVRSSFKSTGRIGRTCVDLSKMPNAVIETIATFPERFTPANPQ